MQYAQAHEILFHAEGSSTNYSVYGCWFYSLKITRTHNFLTVLSYIPHLYGVIFVIEMSKVC